MLHCSTLQARRCPDRPGACIFLGAGRGTLPAIVALRMSKSSYVDGQGRRRWRGTVEAERDERRVVVRSLLMPAAREPGGTLARLDTLTPYAAETIAEDALRLGRGARLEVTVAAETGDAGLAYAERALGRLRKWGVQVHVVRSEAEATLEVKS
jgi:hypothetical protein